MFTGINHFNPTCHSNFPYVLDNIILNETKSRMFNFERWNRDVYDFVSTGTSSDSFQTTQDGDPATLVFNNFVVNAGHTVTTSNRCKGLYLCILGDLIVNGTLSMTARGASAPGKYVLINKWNGCVHYLDDIEPFKNSRYYKEILKENYTVISKTGGLGTVYSKQSYANPGVNGACGAGGHCGEAGGGSGTSFSGRSRSWWWMCILW